MQITEKAVPRVYTIRRAGENADWQALPSLAVDQVLWLPDCGVRAFGQVCHDGECLHVRLRAVESDIRATYTAPLSPVCRDSCLEFFFMAENEDRYFNFEINPNGCLYIGFGHNREDSTALWRDGMKELFGIRTCRTADGWEAAYRIPLSFLRLFWPGYTFTGMLRANVYKCGDETARPHYLSWNPVVSAAPDFHRPECFGTMFFES